MELGEKDTIWRAHVLSASTIFSSEALSQLLNWKDKEERGGCGEPYKGGTSEISSSIKILHFEHLPCKPPAIFVVGDNDHVGFGYLGQVSRLPAAAGTLRHV